MLAAVLLVYDLAREGSARSPHLRDDAKQLGLLNRVQAIAAGHTKWSILRNLESGRWRELLPGVYLVSGAPPSRERDWMAASLWGQERCALSHETAGERWGLWGVRSNQIHISILDGRHPPSDTIAVHRVDDLLLPEIVALDAMPLTSLRRTLVDLAGGKIRRFGVILDRALLQHEGLLGELWLLVDSGDMRGRRGVGIVRDALVPRTPGLALAGTALERLARRVLDRGGLPRPAPQYEVLLPWGPVHIDLAYPRVLLGIECDSRAFHLDEQAFERDRERDVELTKLGWVILRFTWAQLHFRPHYVIETVRHQLEARARLLEVSV